MRAGDPGAPGPRGHQVDNGIHAGQRYPAVRGRAQAALAADEVRPGLQAGLVCQWDEGRSVQVVVTRERRQRRPISRVLFLAPVVRTRGDDHFSRTPVTRRLQRPNPRARAGHPIALLFGLAPGGVCRAGAVARAAGELLPHRFTLTPCGAVCFLLRCPRGCPRLGVTQHPALRSPDFPRALARGRPAGSSWSKYRCGPEALARSPSYNRTDPCVA